MRRKSVSKFLAAVVTTAMLVTSVCVGGGNVSKKAEAASFTNLNQSQMVSAMGAGWNLGNQMESVVNGVPNETNWGNPVITENLIKAVKKAGFKSIRIPVSYISMIDDNNGYTINSSWLNRVKEVVDMCVDNDLYAIINVHGDGYTSIDKGWLLCGSSDQTTIKAKYKAVWKQIATKFKDYNEHLIFESMNEEFDGTYGTPNSTAYSNINAYNQIFVDTVRQTGGNNNKRWLLIPGWNTNINYTAGDYGFKLPTDNYLSSSISSSEKRIMISVHYYDPWDFCGTESSEKTQWGSVATNSSKVPTWGDESYLNSQFKSMYNKFVKSGYPVVIGEYGSIDKSTYDSNNTACRAEFAKKVCTYAKNYGLVPVLWDNGVTGTYGFAVIDRSTYKVTQQKIIDAIMSVYKSDSSSSSDNTSTSTSENVLFSNGSTGDSYSTSDASWLLKANDSDVIKIVYTCSDSSHGNWGVLSWGASVDGNWVNGPSYSAASTASDEVTVTTTAAKLKSALSISSSSSVSYLALSAYNGGKIIKLAISSSSSSSSSSSNSSSSSTTTKATSMSANDLTRGVFTSNITAGDFVIGASSSKNVSVESCNVTVSGTKFTKRIKMNGGGSSAGRYIKFTTTAAATLEFVGASTSTSARTFRVAKDSVGGTTVADKEVTGTAGTYSITLSKAGTYYLYSKSSGVLVYQMTVK